MLSQPEYTPLEAEYFHGEDRRSYLMEQRRQLLEEAAEVDNREDWVAILAGLKQLDAEMAS